MADLKPLDLGGAMLAVPVALAPLAGITDLPFRQLLLLGWGDPHPLGGRELLKTAVYRLRLKLESSDPAARGCIRSVRGVGYRYVVPSPGTVNGEGGRDETPAGGGLVTGP